MQLKKLFIIFACVASVAVGGSVSVLAALQLAGVVDVFAGNVSVEFRNFDNTFLWGDSIPAGTTVKYEGVIPVRPSTDDYDYTFVSWDKSLSNVVKDTVFYAQFQNTPKKFKVTFLNYDQKELYIDYVQKGGTAEYIGAVPVRPNDENGTYEFIGWDVDLTNITQNTVATAQFKAHDVTYAVKFLNYNGSLLYTDYVKKGDTANYVGTTPFRESTSRYDYVFSGWDRNLENVESDFSTNALFDAIPAEYEVNFYNYDNSLLYTDYVGFRQDAKYVGATPTKPESDGYIYLFSGWNKPITDIVSDLDVIAQFEKSPRSYIVNFFNYDGTFLYSDLVEYQRPAYYEGDTPTRPDDEMYTYTFSGWDRDLTCITEDLKVFASYEKELRKFDCTFRNYDGTELYKTQVTYGETAKYIGDTPVRDGDFYSSYKFIGWDKELEYITEDTIFTAQFEKIDGGGGKDKFTSVYFLNYDTTMLDFDYVKVGEAAFYHGPEPKREDNYLGYSYEFHSWSRSFDNIEFSEIGIFVFAQYKVVGSDLYDVHYRNPFTNDSIYEELVWKGGSSTYKGSYYDYLSPENGFVGWDHDTSNVQGPLTIFPVIKIGEEADD